MTDEERITKLEERVAITEEQLAVVLTAYRMLAEKEAEGVIDDYVSIADAQA